MNDKILYIDDEFFNLQGFKALFGNTFEVLTALSTQQADAILKENTVKVILSDQKMPDETGLDYFKRIRPVYPDIVFMIVTGYADMDLVIEAINSSLVYQFVTKPWNKNDLRLAIQQAVGVYNLSTQNQLLIAKLEEKNAALKKNYNELLKTTQALSENEAQFRQFFNKSTDAIFVANVETGRIVDANEKAAELMDTSVDQIIGLNHFDIHPHEYQKLAVRLFKGRSQKIIQGVDVKSAENFLLSKTGKHIPVEINASLVNIQGEPHIMGMFRDISDRKRAENKLVDSELKYRTAFRTSPDAILITSFDGEFIEVNDGFTLLTQYSTKDIFGKTVYDLKLWKNNQERKQFFELFQKNGSVSNFESRFLTKSGSIIHALVSAKPITLQNKTHILSIARDITDRKIMEEKIVSSEKLLNTVLESAPYLIVLLNEQDTIIKVNLKPKELIKKELPFEHSNKIGYLINCTSFREKVSSSELPIECRKCRITKIYKETFETGVDILKREIDMVVFENGVPLAKTFLVSSKLIHQNKQKYVLLTLDDITERKMIEEALVVSKEQAIFNEKRFSLLSNLTFEGIILHQDMQIADVNKSMLRISGFRKNELLDSDLVNLLFPEQYHQMLRSKIRNSNSAPFEVVLVRKNGEELSVELENKIIRIRNRAIAALAVRDITERKATEKQLLKAIIKAEEDQKTKFAQELHDGLGPILSNVQMYFQWLADADENRTFVLDKGLISLKSAFNTLREISNNLSPHILHDFGLIKALERFVEQLPPLATQQINIESFCETLRFEPNIEVALYRVITELINNSRKYGKAKHIGIKITESTDYIFVDYTDNGIGFNVDEALANRNGHGLINMQNRMKTLNGEIIINSGLNKGMQVFIKAPKK
jgi:PAS domain S-box-containing protein